MTDKLSQESEPQVPTILDPVARVVESQNPDTCTTLEKGDQHAQETAARSSSKEECHKAAPVKAAKVRHIETAEELREMLKPLDGTPSPNFIHVSVPQKAILEGDSDKREGEK